MNDKAKIIKIVTVALIVFIVLLFISLMINLLRLAKTDAREKQLQANLAEVNRRIAEAENEVEYKETDEYLQWYAREYLNMKGKGSKAVKVK